jgi:L-alanine-DL-glutamate epimerase-like enolase superfamily enzyme
MRIAAIELRRYALPLDPPFAAAWDPVPRTRFEATVVFVRTDEGITGVGSGDTMDGFERWVGLFLGEDPLALERHVRVLETIAFHAARYWPLEAALWDVAGKAAGKPVATLLAPDGHAGALRAYASFGEARPPGERAEAALRALDEGFRAVKVRIDRGDVDGGLAAVRAVREAAGDSLEVAVDLNEGWRMPGDVSPPLAPEALQRVAAELRELGVLWLEEPLPGEDVRGLAELRSSSGLRIAGGEMARRVADLLAYREADSLDVYQPDAVLAVGLLRAREVGETVRRDGRWFTPHTWTNGLGLVANLHVAAAAGAGPYLEFPYDPPAWTPERRDFLLAEPVSVDREGLVRLPDEPGLGVRLADELERYRVA